MKTNALAAAAAALLCATAQAGTYTWTGEAGDGKWTTAGNWNYDGAAAASAPANNFPATDSVLIDGDYAVNYDGGGDPEFYGPLTITGGATWRQGCNAWARIVGKVIVDNGAFHSGDNQGNHYTGYGHVEVRNGGLFAIDRGLNNGFIYQSLTVESGGRVEIYGNDLTLTPEVRIDATGVVWCDQNVVVPTGVAPGSGTIVCTNATNGKLMPQNGATFRSTTWECRVIHPDSGSATTLRSGSLRLVSDWSDGFEQEGGAYLDFVTGSTFTLYIRSFASDVYGKTFGSDATNPKFRLNGQVVSAADFADKFIVADAGDGYASVQLNISATAALFDETAIEQGTSDSTLLVSATFSQTGEPAATVYLAYAATDLGRDFAAWTDKITVGTASAAGFDAVAVSGVPAKSNLVFRLFVGTAAEFDVSDPVSLYTRYYGEELQGTTVREWVGGGGDNLFSTAANWFENTPPAKNGWGWYLENILIDEGAVVDYHDCGDLQPADGVTVRIAGGAQLLQSDGAWPNIIGLLVLDNGTYDSAAAGQFRLPPEGEVRVRNGGLLRLNQFTRDGTGDTVVLQNGAIEATGFYRAAAEDTYAGGTVTSAGEFRYGDGTLIDGTAITATKLVALSAGDAITFQSGSLVVTGTSDYGFANNGGYIEVPSDSTASFTFPYSKAQIEANVLPKFRLSGVAISRFDDDEWLVVETVDGDSTVTTFTHKAVAGQLPVVDLGSVAVSAETAATVSATLEAGAPLESLKIRYGTNRANLTEELAFSGNVADLADDDPITFALSGLQPHRKYYFQIVARNEVGETATLLLDAATFVTFVPTAASAVWTGAESTAASDPRNWQSGAVPTSSSDVMVADIYAVRKRIDWDLPGATVNSWTQESFGGESVFVSFQTTAAAPLAVTGDVVFDAGTWTHAGPADEPTAMVNVSVGGDMAIGAGARIFVGTAENQNEDDGVPRGYTRGHGPGYLRTAGGSHAGEGGHTTNTTGFVSYGSILDPLSYGSGGWGDNTAYAGGGVVKLAVGGALAMDGAIRSRGFGYPLPAEETIGGSGSGGSINITAASLSGAGSIDANGGANGLYGPGSGGRVKVALTDAGATFDDFTGTIEAVGGSMQNADTAAAYDVSPAAAGTVCLMAPGADPLVKVDNVFRYNGGAATWRVPAGESVAPATHLPAMQDGDTRNALQKTDWELSGHGALRLTQDLRVQSLTLAETNGTQCVYTEGHTLTVKTLEIAGTAKRSGVYTAANLPGIVVGAGSVVVDLMPILIMVR